MIRDFGHHQDDEGHFFTFEITEVQEAGEVVAWFEAHGFERAPTRPRQLPVGKQFSCDAGVDEDDPDAFVMLVRKLTDNDAAMLIKLTWGGMQ